LVGIRIRLRTWLQSIAFVLLIALGFPAAASAHGGVADEVSAAPVITSQSHAENNTANAAAPQYFETSQFPTSHPCTGSCCCVGMSHCAPCGSSVSALQGADAGINYDPAARRIGFYYDTRAHALDRKFGLERPPRA
jgi:hypothetical protein